MIIRFLQKLEKICFYSDFCATFVPINTSYRVVNRRISPMNF